MLEGIVQHLHVSSAETDALFKAYSWRSFNCAVGQPMCYTPKQDPLGSTLRKIEGVFSCFPKPLPYLRLKSGIFPTLSVT